MGGLVKAWSSIPPSGGGGDFLNQTNYIGTVLLVAAWHAKMCTIMVIPIINEYTKL